MSHAEVDWPSIIWFVVLTFVITWGIEIYFIKVRGMSLAGVPQLQAQLTAAAVMWVPAAVAYVVGRFVTGVGFADCGLRLAPMAPFAATMVLIPAVFLVIYALTWLAGLGDPEWSLSTFNEMLSSAGKRPQFTGPPGRVLLTVLAFSVLLAPFVNGLAAFGEEFGWRGFLLPKLLPLGHARALLITGVVWGLWHAPLVYAGFNYPGRPWTGIFLMVAFTTLAGAYIGGLQIAYGSVFLAAFAHGVINSQIYGIWRPLFPTVDPAVGGAVGVVGLAVWAVLAVWAWRVLWTG
jgi:membrane protease YdiL (CAAX protease family)